MLGSTQLFTSIIKYLTKYPSANPVSSTYKHTNNVVISYHFHSLCPGPSHQRLTRLTAKASSLGSLTLTTPPSICSPHTARGKSSPSSVQNPVALVILQEKPKSLQWPRKSSILCAPHPDTSLNSPNLPLTHSLHHTCLLTIP